MISSSERRPAITGMEIFVVGVKDAASLIAAREHRVKFNGKKLGGRQWVPGGGSNESRSSETQDGHPVGAGEIFALEIEDMDAEYERIFGFEFTYE